MSRLPLRTEIAGSPSYTPILGTLPSSTNKSRWPPSTSADSFEPIIFPSIQR
ncbi:MAG: hypothetical protein ACRD0Z_04690 [Acidimicrobiales bacterium]